MKRIAVLLCVTAAVACAAQAPFPSRAASPGNPPGPRFNLTVTPRLVMWSPLGHTPIRLRVRIDNPGPEWYCPKLAVEWAPGQTFSRESDCPPWDDMTPEGQAASVYLPYDTAATACCYPPGTHAIRIDLTQGAKHRVFVATVTVTGGE